MGQHRTRRLDLDAVFKSLTPNVYFQPPSSLRMTYPAIRYKRSQIKNTYADNRPYKQNVAYEVTVIDRDPDSPIVEAISLLPKCRHARHYTADDLNHDTFYIEE